MALLWRDLGWTLRSPYEWQPLDFNRAEFSLRLFRRHLSVWQTLCRIQRLDLSPPQNWTHSLRPSLSIYTNFFHEISLCFAWCSLNTTGEGPASCSLWRISHCLLSELGFGEIAMKTLERANKRKMKTVLQFRNLVQPQISWHKPPFTERGLKTEKNPLGCSQGLTTDSGGELEVLKGVSDETDFAFRWLHKPDTILCDIGLGILFTPPANSCHAC